MAGMFDGFGFGVDGPGAVNDADMAAAGGPSYDARGLMEGWDAADQAREVANRQHDALQGMDWGGKEYGRYGSFPERAAERAGWYGFADAIKGADEFMSSPAGRGANIMGSLAMSALTGAAPVGALVGAGRMIYDIATGKIEGENKGLSVGEGGQEGNVGEPITQHEAKSTGQSILDQIYGEEDSKAKRRQLIPYGNDERQYGYGPEHNYFTNNFADGGAVMGPGTGMSDSIPATINGQQPAALSDGEFVIPADIVSAIGDGSSKAGVSKLYEFLDKIRQEKGMDGQPPPLQKSLEQLLMSTRT